MPANWSRRWIENAVSWWSDAREQVLALEHELAREHHRTGGIPSPGRGTCSRAPRSGRCRACSGTPRRSPSACASVDVLLEVAAHLRLERLDLVHALELGGVHEPHRARTRSSGSAAGTCAGPRAACGCRARRTTRPARSRSARRAPSSGMVLGSGSGRLVSTSSSETSMAHAPVVPADREAEPRTRRSRPASPSRPRGT